LCTEEAAAFECSVLGAEISQLEAESCKLQQKLEEVQASGAAANSPLSMQVQRSRLRDEFSELQTGYAELKQWLTASEEASTFERNELREEIQTLQAQEAALRKQLSKPDVPLALSSSSDTSAETDCTSLRAQLSALRAEDSELRQQMINLETVAASAVLNPPPSPPFSLAAAEMVAEVAGEAEQRRWEGIMHEVLEPLRKRSVHLQRR